jgi:hypothetical protein
LNRLAWAGQLFTEMHEGLLSPQALTELLQLGAQTAVRWMDSLPLASVVGAVSVVRRGGVEVWTWLAFAVPVRFVKQFNHLCTQSVGWSQKSNLRCGKCDANTPHLPHTSFH